MKVSDLKEKVLGQVEEENKHVVEIILAEKLREISAMKVCLVKAERKFEEFLNMEIEDAILLQ